MLLVAVVLSTVFTGLAAADHEEEDDDDRPIVNINLGEVIDAIQDLISDFEEFTGNWDQKLKDILIAVLFAPFRLLAQQLVRSVAIVLTNTPSVHPNPAVQSVHLDVLLVTYLLSTLAFAGAGLLYMTGPIFNVSYKQVRMILPRLIAALVFASVSPYLLQYAVDLSDALVVAFAPSDLTASFSEMAGLSTSLVLVWFINAWLLLAVVVMFILRDVYILFVTAISPILALAWAFPKTRKYADTFIGGFWTALAMGPLDLLVLKFNLALLNPSITHPIQSVSNWILGVAGFVLLLWVPAQLYGASQAAVGQAYVLARGVKNRVGKFRRKRSLKQYRENRLQALRQQRQDRSGRRWN